MPRKGWKGFEPQPEGGVLGIDPGGSGGLAYLHGRDYARVWKMPQTEVDLLWLLRRFEKVASFAVMEKVGGMKSDGGSRAFNFGMNNGWLTMGLTALGMRAHFVTPQSWQKDMGCLTKHTPEARKKAKAEGKRLPKDKNIMKRKAQQLWPQLSITLWNADALLIAEYGRLHIR